MDTVRQPIAGLGASWAGLRAADTQLPTCRLSELITTKFEELSRRYSSLPRDGAQSASLDGAVLGDDHGPAIRMPVDDVTVFRAHVDKAKRLDNTGDLADR